MEMIDLIIFSRDNDYGLALGEALSVYKNNFIVRVCRNESELLGIHDFDLLILDSDCIEMGEKFEGDKRVIRLSESQSDVTRFCESSLHKTDEPSPCLNSVLYKYSSVQELAAGILLYYSLLTGKENFLWSGEKSKIIAFCSAKGGVGKTTIAFGAGQALRRYYSKSVLYLSMEEIESTLLYMKGRESGFENGFEEGRGLCEYLYYLFKTEGHKPDAEAFMLCDKFGVKAFMPGRGRNRLRELDSEKMALFFKEISESGAYDYILVDMGESFGDEVKWIFNICHKIVVVSPPEGEHDERQSRFLKYLQFVVGKSSENTIIPVVNKINDREDIKDRKDRKDIKDREDVLNDDESVYIEFDPDSIDGSGEIIEISIDQDFGAGIKNLVKKII